MELPPRIVYVCSLCLRQYDLEEDLRGHMVYYHGCRPVTRAARQSAAPAKKTSVKKTEQQEFFSPPVSPSPSPPPPEELQPLAFQELRVVLRAHMRVPCAESSGCIYKFEDVPRMAVHVKCHKGMGFGCCECGLDLPNWRRCSAHLWKMHQIDVDLLQCPSLGCDYKSPIAALIWRHLRVHKNWRSRVLRRELLRRRAQQKAQEQLAAETDQSPTAATSVPANKTKYYAEKTCEICQRKFVNGKTLSKHVKTVHNKIKPFICSVCGQKTARKASLIIHMRQHTGEKPLKCEHCKFATRDPSSLYKHRQRHGNQLKASSSSQYLADQVYLTS